MHSFNYFQQNLYLQQQYIHHQILMYNQMLNAYNFSANQNFPQITSISDQKEFRHIQNTKNEDTPLIQPKNGMPLKKKINKVPQKYREKRNELNKTEKKKIFLSMMDIKDAQYKKCKASNFEGLLQNTIFENNVKQ
ncbi:unnamed protein product [Paramecium sonneborni]|uniref:Uncharacterized protein n=1 Tax=Paramecium sonneborni TaxID=65129 RepID=A0A8S1MB34_9CILI|nr:unnamed protein product [Paramecium sonneborni]CAD8074953.1 unnamed protein product [Paramecium sonneborni]